jgi:hypothetical protein
MKQQFKSLVEFSKEIERQEQIKKDYIAPTTALTMVEDSNLSIDGKGQFIINDYAHGQIAQRVGIPKQYYDKMAEIPSLRTMNVNAWWRKDEQAQMVRTMDGKARAFLSDRYRPIDNFLILQAFLPALKETHKEVKIWSSNLSDTRMYLQITFPLMQAEVKKGDIVQYGIILTNSEVGAGAVDIKRFIGRLSCMNGAVRESIMRRHHVGKRIDTESQEAYDLFQDDTIKAEIDSLRLRMRDIMTHELSEETFQWEMEKMRAAEEDKIFAVQKTVEEVTKRFNISNKFQDYLISNMVEEGNLNRWGLSNSITALAKEFESADSQYELEKIGGRIIDLPKSEWSTLNVAA